MKLWTGGGPVQARPGDYIRPLRAPFAAARNWREKQIDDRPVGRRRRAAVGGGPGCRRQAVGGLRPAGPILQAAI